ncbi:MAG: hypothetical protein FD143_3181 [Ignavibacteria bacterium]|nr:MAG: hypothetical protein FD143_3181 [Ignavibacteria bacterium]
MDDKYPHIFQIEVEFTCLKGIIDFLSVPSLLKTGKIVLPGKIFVGNFIKQLSKPSRASLNFFNTVGRILYEIDPNIVSRSDRHTLAVGEKEICKRI